jgi:hypothetical protein
MFQIESPFHLSWLKNDRQKEGHGTCRVLASVGLAHALQAKGVLPKNDEHDEDFLTNHITKLNNKPLTDGAVIDCCVRTFP